jgi:hypothetical protein
MGLLDGLTPLKDIDPCRVGKLILELEPDDQKVLLAALEDDRWTARALGLALNARGVTISKDTLQAHMRKTCRCSKI